MYGRISNISLIYWSEIAILIIGVSAALYFRAASLFFLTKILCGMQSNSSMKHLVWQHDLHSSLSHFRLAGFLHDAPLQRLQGCLSDLGFAGNILCGFRWSFFNFFLDNTGPSTWESLIFVSPLISSNFLLLYALFLNKTLNVVLPPCLHTIMKILLLAVLKRNLLYSSNSLHYQTF